MRDKRRWAVTSSSVRIKSFITHLPRKSLRTWCGHGAKSGFLPQSLELGLVCGGRPLIAHQEVIYGLAHGAGIISSVEYRDRLDQPLAGLDEVSLQSCKDASLPVGHGGAVLVAQFLVYRQRLAIPRFRPS